jgi:hypothetical protein
LPGQPGYLLFTPSLGLLAHLCFAAAAAADLPALQAVGQDLRADAGLVAASVAIYMLTVGLGSLFWGPMVRQVDAASCTSATYFGSCSGA